MWILWKKRKLTERSSFSLSDRECRIFYSSHCSKINEFVFLALSEEFVAGERFSLSQIIGSFASLGSCWRAKHARNPLVDFCYFLIVLFNKVNECKFLEHMIAVASWHKSRLPWIKFCICFSSSDYTKYGHPVKHLTPTSPQGEGGPLLLKEKG